MSNLALIERVISFTCRRGGLDAAATEEFAGVVRLKLVENDYAILTKFEGRSRLSTYLTVVIQRMLLDYRVETLGKWRPSAEARRLGPVAVDFERLVRRDGRSIDEALVLLQQQSPDLTRADLEELSSRLPPARPRRREVPVDEAELIPDPTSRPLGFEESRASGEVSRIVRRHLEEARPEDRLILQLRFEAGMSTVQIARSLKLDAKGLYRRLEKHMRRLREALEEAGVSAADAADLIGNRGVVLDFGMAGGSVRQEDRL